MRYVKDASPTYWRIRLKARDENQRKNTMRLVDRSSRLMECKVCGDTKTAELSKVAGKYTRESWRCDNGCENDLD